jgi:hypothetical protein
MAYDGIWVEVSSSWLAAVKYDAGSHTLWIRFKDRRTGAYTVTCQYDNIDPDRGMGLIEASSHGEYFHSSGLIRRPYTVVAKA